MGPSSPSRWCSFSHPWISIISERAQQHRCGPAAPSWSPKYLLIYAFQRANPAPRCTIAALGSTLGLQGAITGWSYNVFIQAPQLGLGNQNNAEIDKKVQLHSLVPRTISDVQLNMKPNVPFVSAILTLIALSCGSCIPLMRCSLRLQPCPCPCGTLETVHHPFHRNVLLWWQPDSFDSWLQRKSSCLKKSTKDKTIANGKQ